MPEPNYATSPADFRLDEIARMSGLEMLQGIIDGTVFAPPIARTLGYRLWSVEPGRAVFRGVASFDYMNPSGVVHGGWYGTLLDSCMACAVLTRLAVGQAQTTLEYKINIIRPVPDGMEVDAIGEAQHVGRSTGVASGRLVGVADGRVYATGSTTLIVMGG
ncbi:MAG: PaaI family thioesterase [Pseudomonadota bacterium]